MRSGWLWLFPALMLAQAPPAKKATDVKPAAASAKSASYRDLKFPPLRQVEIPHVEIATLSNGMKVYLLEDNELPMVNGLALIRTGNLFDPPDKRGLSDMTGMVMRTGGTKRNTGDELDEKLENLAASVETSIGETSARATFSALKENTDEVLGVFKEVLSTPEFRQEKIDLAKNEMRSSISRRNDDPQGIAQREFAAINYGRDNPYGWSIEYEHINRIARDDLIAYYNRYFFPENVMLAVYGDFSTAEMKAKLEKVFADWTVKQPTVPPFPAVTPKPAAGLYVADKPDAPQTFFAIGHLGGILKDKDYAALEVMADILGGGFRSRLFQKVRGQLGYAYSVGAQWGANFNHPGLFQISGSTRAMNTVDTFQVIEEEVGKIRSQPVTDEELRLAKETVQNSFVFHFDTRAKTIGRIMNYEYHGYPRDFLFQYQKAIAGVSKADVQRAAGDRLKPKDLVFVAVGNPKEFVKPLDKLGRPVSTIDLTIPEAKPEAGPADAASLAKGKELLQRAQNAAGGADKLAAVKDVRQTAEVEMDAAAGGMKIKQVNRWLAPKHFRQELELPFGKMATYSDGQTGFMIGPQGDRPLMGAQMKQAQGEIFRTFVRLLLSDRDPERSVNHLGGGVVEISDKEGNSTRITFDEATGLPAKQSYQGPQAPVEETWSDYRDVSGIKVPHKIALHQGGRKFADVIIREVAINTGATVEQFSKRQP